MDFLRRDAMHLRFGFRQQFKGPEGCLLRRLRKFRARNQRANLRPVPAVRVPVRMHVVMMMLVVSGTLHRNPMFQHVNLGGPNPAAIHRMNPQLRPDLQRRSRLMQNLRRHTRFDQRAQQHVSGDSGKALNLANFHKILNR